MESKSQLQFFVILIVSTVVIAGNVSLRPIFERTDEIDFFGNPLGQGRQSQPLTEETQRFRAKFHVQNQQMRFNSEKDRMQKAQVRRFREIPPEVMDSYIKAHVEQQENYQKELEQKFIREITAVAKERNLTKQTENKKEFEKPIKPVSVGKIIDGQSMSTVRSTIEQVKSKRSENDENEKLRRTSQKTPRNVEYSSYPRYNAPLHRKNPKGYEQIRYGPQFGRYYPNGNRQNVPVKYAPSPQLYAEDISSLTSSAFKYPSKEPEFSQLNMYKNEDVESSLEALLGREPNDQIKGLNILLQKNSANHKVTSADLRNININLKSSSLDVPTHYYEGFEEPTGTFVTPTYVYDPKEDYVQVKDHTPITENVQDVIDTRQPVKIITTQQINTENPATISSSENYYKVVSDFQELPTSVATSILSPAPAYNSGYDNLQYASKYEFGYRVRDPHSGSDFGHTEVSNGNTASGSYHVLLPDGRLQKVKYHAGPDGYKAQVTYH